MARNEAVEWMEVATSSIALAIESAGVVGLRAAKAARGAPGAADEAWRMCSEKVTALAELQTQFLIGWLDSTPSAAAKGSLKHYRRKVAANWRRLSKS